MNYCCCFKSSKKNRVSPHGLIYKNFPHFVNQDGMHLFCRYWEPITTPRALMMILHGGGEHSGCFKNITPIFTNLSMFVFAHDYKHKVLEELGRSGSFCGGIQQATFLKKKARKITGGAVREVGHGHSEGPRLRVPEFSNYIRDSIQHMEMMRVRYPTLPMYILSNSMGALIAINVLVQKPENIAGMIFIAPLVQMNPESATPLKMFCAKVMYHLMPNLVLGHLDPQWLSSSPEEVQKMVDDPLHSLGPYRMRFTVQVLEAVAKVKALLPLIQIPLLIAHGEFDKLCDINGSILLYTSVASQDKTMKIFKDAFAQLHNEAPSITRELQVLIRKWLMDRLPPMAE